MLLEATQFISSKEVAFIYDCPQQEIERELKITTETKSTNDRSKMRTLLKWIAKKRPGVNTRSSSLRLIKILKGWEKFSRSNKGYMFVCEFVHAYYITRFDVR